MNKIETTILLIYSSLVGFACCLLFFFENSLKINNMEEKNLNEAETPQSNIGAVSGSIYGELGKFINKSDERIFNDRLMILTCIEISIKSKGIDGELILPRYRNYGVWYKGEYYPFAAQIKTLMPKKAFEQLNLLIEAGSKIDFKNRTQIKNWIASQTGISDSSLSVVV